MTHDQFENALDRYGNDIDSWPPTLRDIARGLLAESPRAVAMWRQASQIEAVLRAHDPGLRVPPEQVRRVLDAVMTRIDHQERRPRPLYLRLLDALQIQVGSVNWAPRLAASVVIGLGVGLMAGSAGLMEGAVVTPFDLLSLSDPYLLLGL